MPLAAMRAAAEALADTEPGAPGKLQSDVAPSSPRKPQPGKKDVLREALREAVQAELSREISAQKQLGGSGSPGDKKADVGSESGHGAQGQARSAAVQAQQAQRNSTVGKSHGLSVTDKPLPAASQGRGLTGNVKP
jgi:hypothetical protein